VTSATLEIKRSAFTEICSEMILVGGMRGAQAALSIVSLIFCRRKEETADRAERRTREREREGHT